MIIGNVKKIKQAIRVADLEGVTLTEVRVKDLVMLINYMEDREKELKVLGDKISKLHLSLAVAQVEQLSSSPELDCYV